MRKHISMGIVVLALALTALVAVAAQTLGGKEEFSAGAIANNNLRSGAGRVDIQINPWSTDGERSELVNSLLQKGASKLLDKLHDQRPVGTIRTPDSLGYDLRYAHQTTDQEGGRRIVLATDRPISFWEASQRPRTIDYSFTVIQ